MNKYMEERNEKGFTLIELLIAIVVVGILTAVAIVGIAGLTDKGSGSACSATFDAVRAAEAVYYANSAPPNKYPTKFTDLQAVGSTPAVLETPGGVAVAATTLTGNGWVLTTTGNTGAAPLAITASKDAAGTQPLTSCK